MDKFFIEDSKYRLLTSDKAVIETYTSVLSSIHINKHYCSFDGGIISKAENGWIFSYKIIEGEDWKLLAQKELLKKGMSPSTSTWGIAFDTLFVPLYNDICGITFLVSFANTVYDLASSKAFHSNDKRIVLNAVTFPKNFDVPDDGKCWIMALQLFSIFDYVQKKAMKEKHKIERIRKQATHGGKSVRDNLSEPSPIWIRDGIQYIYTYEDKPKTHREILCELWSVRGHYRHYKSGKVTFIAPYQKGKKRNEGIAPGHTYILAEGERNGE